MKEGQLNHLKYILKDIKKETSIGDTKFQKIVGFILHKDIITLITYVIACYFSIMSVNENKTLLALFVSIIGLIIIFGFTIFSYFKRSTIEAKLKDIDTEVIAKVEKQMFQNSSNPPIPSIEPHQK